MPDLCRNGHELVGDNVKTVYPENASPYRFCRVCKRLSNEKRNAVKREETRAKQEKRITEIRRLHAEGMPIGQIQKHLKIGYDTARSALDPEYGERYRERKEEMARNKREAEEAARNGGRPRTPLMIRHEAAMSVVKILSVAERWELLAAVVWPTSDELVNMEREAA